MVVQCVVALLKLSSASFWMNIFRNVNTSLWWLRIGLMELTIGLTVGASRSSQRRTTWGLLLIPFFSWVYWLRLCTYIGHLREACLSHKNRTTQDDDFILSQAIPAVLRVWSEEVWALYGKQAVQRVSFQIFLLFQISEFTDTTPFFSTTLLSSTRSTQVIRVKKISSSRERV